MIKRTICKFLRITSVKGIPRLLRTRSRFMRFVWGLSILCFLVVATYQSTMLTMAYLEYSTVTSIQELPLDLTGQYEHSTQLPDVTFCNVNPFASSYTQDTEMPSIKDYITKVQEMTVCDRCSWDQNISMSQLRDELMTSRGYRIQVGHDKARSISHQIKTFFSSCAVWVMAGMHSGNLPCKNVMSIDLHQDSIFYNCFTLKPTVEHIKERAIRGVLAVFHLDDYTMNSNPYVLPLHPQISYINGIIFTFNERGTPPVTTKNGMLLQPGLFSELRLRVVRRKRLSAPYGRCVAGHEKENEFNIDGKYSQLMCFSLCSQQMVDKLCGCIDNNNYVDVYSRAGKPLCLKLDQGKEHLWKEWECLQHARNVSAISCTDKCPLPCEEVTFDEKVTHTSWPSGQLKAFYREFISNRSYASHYKALADDNGTNFTDWEQFKTERLVKQHFVGVHMYVDQTTMMEYKDQPQLSFIAFVSQLGGALNLWAGITVVVVIEIAEVLFELVVRKFGLRREDSDPSSQDCKCKPSDQSNTQQERGINDWL